MHCHLLKKIPNGSSGMSRRTCRHKPNYFNNDLCASGLEVKDHSLEIDIITAIPRHVVNIGDMMSRLTNNVLHSSIHRVINPTKEE